MYNFYHFEGSNLKPSNHDSSAKNAADKNLNLVQKHFGKESIYGVNYLFASVIVTGKQEDRRLVSQLEKLKIDGQEVLANIYLFKTIILSCSSVLSEPSSMQSAV